MSYRSPAKKKSPTLLSCLLVLAQILGVFCAAGICQTQDKIKEYRQRLESTPPTDAGALYKLSTWCAQNDLPIQRILVLQRVITACPEHDKARLELGFIKHKGKWLTQAEVNISKGLTLIDGEWLAKNEAKEKLKQKEVDRRNEKTQLIQQLGAPDPVKHKGAHDTLITTATEADLKFILRYLQDREAVVRRNTVILLGRLGFSCAKEPLLKTAYSDPDPETRRSAILMIGKLGDLSAVSTLMRALEDADQYFRRNAEEALEILLLQQFHFKYCGKPEEQEKGIAEIREYWQKNQARTRVELALNTLKSDNPYVREEVARVLAKESGDKALEALKGLASDTEAKTREAAVNGLAKFPAASVIDVLKKALKDEAHFVQQAAIRGLDTVLGKDKPAELCSILRENFEGFKHAYVIADAVTVLGKYKDLEARPIFRKILKEQTYWPTVNPTIRAIVQVNDIEALEELQAVQAANEAFEVRNEVVVAYADLGGRLAAEAILPFMKDKAYTVRRTAAVQLGRLLWLKAAPALLEAMDDPEDRDLRRVAWESLMKISKMDMNFRWDNPAEDRKKDLVPWHAWWDRAKNKATD